MGDLRTQFLLTLDIVAISGHCQTRTCWKKNKCNTLRTPLDHMVSIFFTRCGLYDTSEIILFL